MKSVYDQAEMLAALIKLGGQQQAPDHSGILDRALQATLASLPPEFASSLSFACMSVGTRCYELPDIVLAGIEGGLFDWARGNMRQLAVRIDYDEARSLAVQHGYSTQTATEAGRILTAAILNEQMVLGGLHHHAVGNARSSGLTNR